MVDIILTYQVSPHLPCLNLGIVSMDESWCTNISKISLLLLGLRFFLSPYIDLQPDLFPEHPWVEIDSLVPEGKVVSD